MKAALMILLCATFAHGQAADFSPRAVPLVTHDPYFSIWSRADHLIDDVTRHWTGAPHPLTSLVRIDGKTFRIMGMPKSKIPALPQVEVKVSPMQTMYKFEGEGVRVWLSFCSPTPCDDLETLSRPVTYLFWNAASQDGKPHDVSIYFDCESLIAVHEAKQEIVGDAYEAEGFKAFRFGTKDQPVLKRAGDGTRVDWGHLYAAADEKESSFAGIGLASEMRDAFAAKKEMKFDAPTFPRPASDGAAIGFVFDFGKVTDQPTPKTLMLAYDEIYSIQLMGKNLRPYWRRDGDEPKDLFKKAWADRASERARGFDFELNDDMKRVGGENYARIGAMAYRQALAGCTLAADESGRPLMFAKENTSNGCISTVDVIYPAAPIYLLFNPSLLEAHLTPIFDYAESSRWKFPFAPHDLGTYPLANGQVYGGGEKTEENQMPVEESGNMILMVAGVAKARGDAKYAEKHWAALTKWAGYLREKGFDPENQLCTDDFMGHLAHNVNLSAKTICALGSYAMLADMLGHKAEAEQYRSLAKEFAARWVKEADDGDHFRLTFDRAGTWSQKYNLVWDKLLGLNLFPADVLKKEMAFYRKQQDRFGLPLDSRKHLTKSDWLVWTATMGSREDFDALIAPLADFLANSPSRVPFADIYNTTDGLGTGMNSRPVIGGVFIKMLDDPATWQKWASRTR